MEYTSVFFVHLPKTGGTTTRRILDRQYRDFPRYEIGDDITGDIRAFRIQDWTVENKPALVQGHMSFGLHEYVPGTSVYLTLLREPIGRALSDYHYVTSTPTHPIYKHVKNLSLVEYFQSGITGQLSNGQIRLLSGNCLTNDVGVPSKRQMEQTDLELAVQNLAREFIAIGLLERFDESLLLFRRRLNWRWPFYMKENVTSRMYHRKDISNEDIETIRRLNVLDIELYQKVKLEFERQIKMEGMSFKRELITFKLLNRIWGFLARTLPPSVSSYAGKMLRSLR